MIKLKIGDNITFSATVISVDGNYKELIEFYGKEAQARQAMEECAELIQAINKRLRYPKNDKALDGLYEEMADVEIMMDQLRIMFDLDEFFQQMDYLIPELYRITKPGRIIALHVKQIPTFKGRDGAMGLVDFRGMVIRAFQKHKWTYHGEITVFTDPQIEATRTKSASILWNSYKKFAEITRTGMPDYVILMQKHEREDEWIHVKHENSDEQFHNWTRLASPCWGIGEITPKVSRTNVLNTKIAKEDKDEKHMTPLQLDLIEHLIRWYTNEDEVVLDPFGGVMSVPYSALKLNRKAIGIELKESYYNTGKKYIEKLQFDMMQPTLF